MKATFCQQWTVSLHLGLVRSEIKPRITDVDTQNHTVHFQKQLIYAKFRVLFRIHIVPLFSSQTAVGLPPTTL